LQTLGTVNRTAKIVSVVMVALSLYIFNPLLCFIVLVAPIPTLYTTYVGNKLRFKFVRDNGKILREAGYYQNVMLGGSAKEIKALNLFDFFFAKWKALADDYVVKEKKNQLHVFLLGTVSGSISNLAVVVANVFAIVLMARGRLSSVTKACHRPCLLPRSGLHRYGRTYKQFGSPCGIGDFWKIFGHVRRQNGHYGYSPYQRDGEYKRLYTVQAKWYDR
jgi:hypothetical protein